MALILFGGRAGAVVSPTLLFLLPLAFGHGKLKPSQTWRILLFGGIGAAGVAVVALASYAFQFASTTGQSQGALIGAFTRIVLQGHVWWNIYYTTTISHIGDTGSSFWNEIKGFFAWAPGKTGRGSDLVMRLIAPKILYEGAVEQDIAFAGGWPALGLYYFGPYLLQIVQALLALLYGGTALLLKRDLLRGHYVSAMILFFIWWQLLAEVVLNANWYLLLNIRTAVFLALYFILQRRTPHLRRFVMKMMTLPASSQQRNDATS
jgi:hypothetical protein